jgi:orotate phosphoribosyltransferase
MLTAARAIDLLAEIGAILPTRDGMHIDPACVGTHPSPRSQVGTAVAESIRSSLRGDEILVAPTTDTIALVSLVAERLGRPMAYVRSKAKVHGKQKQVEGAMPEAASCVLIAFQSPTAPSAPSLADCVSVLRAAGASSVRCVLIVDDVLQRERAELATQGVDVTGLASVKDARFTFDASRRETWAPVWVAEPFAQHRWPATLTSTRSDPSAIARILLEIGAVTVSSDRPYRYTSGLLSPIYADNRLLISHPVQWRTVINGFVDLLANSVGLPNVDAVAGTATSGIPHAALAADRLSLPMVYVAPDEQDGGHVQGDAPADSRIVMIEDHITTGGSALSSAKVLRRNAVVVDWCLAIFTYSTERARERFTAMGMRVATLCDLDVLLDTAVGDGTIKSSSRDAVRDWVRDPETWSARAEEKYASTRID